MSAERKDDSNSKQSRRRAVTSTIRRSLRGEWQALSTSSSPRASLSLDREEEQSQDKGPHQRGGGWHRLHTAAAKHETSVRSLAELLVAGHPADSGDKGAERKEARSGRSWGLGWSDKPRRFNARHMFRKIGRQQSIRETHHGLAYAAEEYPQSDDPAGGQGARERKRKLDAVYKQMVWMARDLGSEPIGRMEAAGFLSLAHGDVDAALRHLHIVLCTRDGILYDVDPRIALCGAVNSGGTSCYIDSLMMALFGAQSSYDALLYLRDLRSDPANKLLAVSRLFVNFLRAGELIDVWLVEEMRAVLVACGWLDGAARGTAKTMQQDTSELYMFLMDALHMPFLPLEMRMVHGADHDAADCKMVTQRMIELSFPETSSTSSDTERPLLLQALLESYFFDNRVEHLERSLKEGGPGGQGSESLATKVRTNAWSFLSIYPFYTPQSELGSNGPDGAAEYPDDAPFILPLLIKRYAVDEQGDVQRVDRRVIIPMVLDVTDIVNSGDENRYADDNKPGNASLRSDPSVVQDSGQSQQEEDVPQPPPPPPYPSRVQYRLVLRSAVCHKGDDVRSGHYVSFSTRLRMVRPADIARQRLRGEDNRSTGVSAGRLRAGHLAMSLNDIDTRWQALAAAHRSLSRSDIPAGTSKENDSGAAMTAPAHGISRYVAQTTQVHTEKWTQRKKQKRRHSWPLLSDVAQNPDAILHDSSSSSSSTGSSTPTGSLSESAQIHGSAADWENYAMTINVDEQQQQGMLRNVSEEISGDMRLLGNQPPPSYSDDAVQNPPLCCDSGTAECVTTTGELLRFDDMDFAHDRVQYFSTGEGGRRCLDEISRDGYLLFYALQRVEMHDDSAEENGEGLDPSQAMDELASALRKNERDEHARRVIAALMRNSGAMDSSFDETSGGKDFEAMAMRWQNIRANKQTSPVGPLLGRQKRRPDQQSQRSNRGGGIGRRVKSSDEAKVTNLADSWVAGDPVESGNCSSPKTTSTSHHHHHRHNGATSDQCLLM